jgi:hypothetical protein
MDAINPYATFTCGMFGMILIGSKLIAATMFKNISNPAVANGINNMGNGFLIIGFALVCFTIFKFGVYPMIK